MADHIDSAENEVEAYLELARNARKKVPEKTGECLAPGCGEPTEGAFCSRECREDYEKMVRLQAITGKK